jgi:hypothetical protein
MVRARVDKKVKNVAKWRLPWGDPECILEDRHFNHSGTPPVSFKVEVDRDCSVDFSQVCIRKLPSAMST